jgi:dTDP-glucose 4,6-dehydratase
MTRVLITGGAGFAGHHLIEHLLINTDWEIVVLDKLTYASFGWRRLRDIGVYWNDRVSVYPVDFTEPFSCGLCEELGQFNFIIHMGAETHVDGSIVCARPFVRSNVLGTYELLEFARKQKNLDCFVYFSTDEVFGPAPEGIAFKEWDRYNCTNPYAATKAGAEELCLAFGNSYKIPVLITHTMNLIGERQHYEKFLPLVINKVLKRELVTIHAAPDLKSSGKRHYLHCRNMADAVLFLLSQYIKYNRFKVNIVGEQEVDNLYFAKKIAEVIDKPLHYELVDFHSSRPGHDLRYALDGSLLADMGWKPPKTFEESLTKTVQWYLSNPMWLEGGWDGI